MQQRFILDQARDRETAVRSTAMRRRMPTDKAEIFQALRREWILWAGSLGGAITLLGSIEPLLQLADWARFIVGSWRGWTHQLWGLVFPYRLTPLARDVLTFDALVLM